MTELSHASGSTATPPKLLDTDFGEDGEDGFGDIFAGVGAEKRRSRLEMQKEPGVSDLHAMLVRVLILVEIQPYL
jgi:hypothetical protein